MYEKITHGTCTVVLALAGARDDTQAGAICCVVRRCRIFSLSVPPSSFVSVLPPLGRNGVRRGGGELHVFFFFDKTGFLPGMLSGGDARG